MPSLHRERGGMLKPTDFAERFATSSIRHWFIVGEADMYRKEIPVIPVTQRQKRN